MIQGALEADGRIAAKNAVKIRAALHQVTDFKRVFNKYQETHPQPTNNVAQDRARARSWIILNVYLNNEAIKSAVMRAWAEAYVLGQAAAGEWIAKTKAANKAADDGYIDWQHWNPGDRATALLLRPTGGFSKYLQQVNAESYFKNFNKETITNLGTALSDSIAAGLDAESAAVMIGRHVADPSRALTIAITEQNRAMSFGSIQTYKEAELEKMEWAVSDPCDICAMNDGQVINIGETFESGDEQPPAHPHCRCVLLPVVPGMEEEAAIPGAFTTPMPTGAAHTGDEPEASPVMSVPIPRSKGEHVPGNWSELSKEEIKQRQMDRLLAKYPNLPNLVKDLVDRDSATKAVINNGKVLANGPIEVRVFNKGMEVPEENIKEILDHLDGLQVTNPKSEEVFLTIGESKAGAYGWAVVDGKDIWIAPRTANLNAPNAAEGGSFKMPALAVTKQYLYTLTHEWGHHIDVSGQAAVTRRITAIKKRFPDAFKSGYSQESRYEFYAEMFAEYYLTGGKTGNELVQAMAQEFGWKA